MTPTRRGVVVAALFLGAVGLVGAVYWQIERLRIEREDAADRSEREEQRVRSVEQMEAAKVAFSQSLVSVATMVERARGGKFTFGKSDQDTLRVLNQLLESKPAPICFNGARAASIKALESTAQFLASVVVDDTAEASAHEGERAIAQAESGAEVLATVEAAKQQVKSACDEWLLKNNAPLR